MGRPPMPPGQARSAKVEGRIKPNAHDEVKKFVESRGITVSVAVREAMALWLREQRKAGK